MRVQQPWAGASVRKPWNYRVTALIPHLATLDMLKACVALLRRQTVRPYIVVIDTGSPFELCDELEAMRADDLEVHFVRGNSYANSSEPVCSALDLGMSRSLTEYTLLLHTDVFVTRQDSVEHMLEMCSREVPVIGWEMSDRSWLTDDWRGMVSHTFTIMHSRTVRDSGASWCMQRWRDTVEVDNSLSSHGWPDTETGFNLCLRAAGVPVRLLGPERNYERQITDFWDHARSSAGSRVYAKDSPFGKKAAEYGKQALADALHRAEEWGPESELPVVHAPMGAHFIVRGGSLSLQETDSTSTHPLGLYGTTGTTLNTNIAGLWSKAMTPGGIPGSNTLQVMLGAANTPLVSAMFETQAGDLDAYAGSIGSGIWTVNLDVISTGNAMALSDCYIIQLSSAGSVKAQLGHYNTLTPLLGGANSVNINTTSYTLATGDRIIALMAFSSTFNNDAAYFFADKTVATTFSDPPPVTAYNFDYWYESESGLPGVYSTDSVAEREGFLSEVELLYERYAAAEVYTSSVFAIDTVRTSEFGAAYESSSDAACSAEAFANTAAQSRDAFLYADATVIGSASADAASSSGSFVYAAIGVEAYKQAELSIDAATTSAPEFCVAKDAVYTTFAYYSASSSADSASVSASQSVQERAASDASPSAVAAASADKLSYSDAVAMSWAYSEAAALADKQAASASAASTDALRGTDSSSSVAAYAYAEQLSSADRASTVSAASVWIDSANVPDAFNAVGLGWAYDDSSEKDYTAAQVAPVRSDSAGAVDRALPTATPSLLDPSRSAEAFSGAVAAGAADSASQAASSASTYASASADAASSQQVGTAAANSPVSDIATWLARASTFIVQAFKDAVFGGSVNTSAHAAAVADSSAVVDAPSAANSRSDAERVSAVDRFADAGTYSLQEYASEAEKYASAHAGASADAVSAGLVVSASAAPRAIDSAAASTVQTVGGRSSDRAAASIVYTVDSAYPNSSMLWVFRVPDRQTGFKVQDRPNAFKVPDRQATFKVAS